MQFETILRPSEILRQCLLPMFPQDETSVEKSEYPIYIDYSFSFDKTSNKRIVILQSSSAAPNRFIGNDEFVSGASCDIIVSSQNADEAYTISKVIEKKLNQIRNIYGIIDIQPLTGVEPMGINSKGFYMFSCTYGIIKEE